MLVGFSRWNNIRGVDLSPDVYENTGGLCYIGEAK